MATYKVKKGDTLRTIAAKAGISLKELVDLNPQISNPNLTSGQVININKAAATDAIGQQYIDAATGDEYLKGRYGPGSGLTAPGTIAADAKADAIVQQYTDAATGNEYLKGRYGPGSGLTAPGAIGTQGTPVRENPVVSNTGTVTATGTATAIPRDINKDIATATASGNEAVKDINEILSGLEATGDNAPKTVKSKTPKYDATGNLIGYDIVYSDGTTIFEPAPSSVVKKFTWKNPTTGQLESFDSAEEMNAAIEVWKYQSGEVAANAASTKAAADARAEALANRTSAFDLLRDQFDEWGLADLVEPIRYLIQDENVSTSEYAIRLRKTKPYLDRFAANTDRITNGYAAINEATYLQLEDQYQRIMTNYGLPESYYARGKNGVQLGFQKLIANDVDSLELEDRIMTAQNRVLKSNPEVLASLKAFYPEITNGDILAYALDPTNGKDVIKRKVTAAEIGGAATQAGLKTGMTRAEELGAAGVTKATAREGFQDVAEIAPRGGQLASIYGQDPYTQTTAETEVFGLSGKTEAAKQRKKVTGLEKATFSGQSGATSSALVRDRAGAY